MTDKLLTPEQAAERLQISVFTLKDYLRNGKIKGVKIANRWRIKEEALENYITEQEKGTS